MASRRRSGPSASALAVYSGVSKAALIAGLYIRVRRRRGAQSTRSAFRAADRMPREDVHRRDL